jgi:exosome complex component RRP4
MFENEDDEDESRKLVIPGDKLIEGNYRSGTGTYSIGNSIYASTVGLMETRGQYINVIPIKGPYLPKVGDLVIGTVISTSIVSWKIYINAPYIGSLHATNYLNRPFNPLKDDIRQYIDIGEAVFSEIISFNRTRDPVLSVRNRGLGKLKGGRLIEVIPTKIPRIIGRKGSMIKLLKDATNCKFKIGQNGIIWLKADNYESEHLVVRLINKIEREAHTLGLTDRIKELIENEKKGSE